MDWLYYVLAAVAVIVVLNVLLVIAMVLAGRDSERH